MKKVVFVALAVMILAQWAVPGKMIFDTERTLRQGDTFKFEIRPLDPSDPFRGKYIDLNFEVNPFIADSTLRIQSGQEVYVQLAKDERGFAKITGLAVAEPKNLSGVLKTRVNFMTKFNRQNGQESHANYVHFKFPFERFYLEESKAPEAEQVAWRTDTTHVHTFYAVVKIKDGLAAIQDVMVNDRSLADVVRELNKKGSASH
jgi:uncharacterized membrane-anchored protein